MGDLQKNNIQYAQYKNTSITKSHSAIVWYLTQRIGPLYERAGSAARHVEYCSGEIKDSEYAERQEYRRTARWTGILNR